jgi:hypothetical protein
MEETPANPQQSSPNRRLLFWLSILTGIVITWLLVNQLSSPADPGPDQGTATSGGLTVNVEDGQVFNEPVLTLAGSGPPDQLIFINGQPIPVGSDGGFELTLQLAEGPNLVQIEARDGDGGTTLLVRQVVYAVPGEPEPVVVPTPGSSAGLLALSLVVIALAVVIVLARRRRPWINVSTDAPVLRPGSTGDGQAVTIVVELDRPARISLFLIDSRGRSVTTLLNNRRRDAGRLTFTFDGRTAGEVLPPGEYRVRAEAGVPLLRSTAETQLAIER